MTINRNFSKLGSLVDSNGVVQPTGGGTGLTSLTANYIPYGNGTSAYQSSANLQFNGTQLGIGIAPSTYPLTTYSTTEARVFNIGDGVGGGYVAVKYSNDATSSINVLRKYRGTYAVPLAVTSSDSMGGVNFQAWGGTTLRTLAQVTGVVDTYVSDTSIGAFLTFGTTPNGSVTITERMRLFASGGLSLGNTTDPGATNLSVTGSITGGAGSFTTLSASSTVSGTGFSSYLASPPAIGGTAAAAGTFTQLTVNGANVNTSISPTGTGTVAISPAGALTINPTAASTINNTSIGATTASTGRFTTVTSTIATGTAPFVVTSTTNVANLNASSLNGATFAAPGAIGSTTASTGAFTTLSATTAISIASGGTNSTATPTLGGVIVGTGTAYSTTAAGTAGQAFVSNGAAAPTWQDLTLTNLPGAWTKKAADCATTAALILNSAQTTIDGITLSSTTRVLVKDQATSSQNGIYTGVTTTSWVRATDAATSANISGGTISVDAGTVNFGTIWTNTFKPTDTLGTTAMPWYKIIDTSQPPTAPNGIFVNSKTISTSYAIPSGSSAHSVGPITLASGQTVTLPTGSKWVIL